MSMRKGVLLFAVIAAISLLLFAGCTKSQPAGYAAYQGGQQPAAVGGGCGVQAPAPATDAAQQVVAAGTGPA